MILQILFENFQVDVQVVVMDHPEQIPVFSGVKKSRYSSEVLQELHDELVWIVLRVFFIVTAGGFCCCCCCCVSPPRASRIVIILHLH